MSHLENELIEMAGRLESVERELKRRPVKFVGQDDATSEEVDELRTTIRALAADVKKLRSTVHTCLMAVEELSLNQA